MKKTLLSPCALFWYLALQLYAMLTKLKKQRSAQTTMYQPWPRGIW